MTIENEQATAGRQAVSGDGAWARAILSLHPGIITAANVAMTVWSMLLTPGGMASILLNFVFAVLLGIWWWALLTMAMRVRPTPGRRWTWLFLLPIAWTPVQWLAERWLGRMDGELSIPQVLFQSVSMIVICGFFYGFWRLARTFEEAVHGEKAKAEQVLATLLQMIFVLVGVWTLRARIRRLLILAN